MKVTVRDVMTKDELIEFYELNFDLLGSATKWERDYYNYEIQKIIYHAKERYYQQKSEESNSYI